MDLTVQTLSPLLFALAILHTFSTKFFEHRAHLSPKHAGIWHLLGEVEVVFGFWAILLIALMFFLDGFKATLDYVDTRNYTEPLFVFVIMIVAATRPILTASGALVNLIAGLLPCAPGFARYVVVLSVVPLLGSFITEPAAMTLAAMMLSRQVFAAGFSERFKYASLGVLFVNVSIGGTLTPFAAPPVLMVAGQWGWDIQFMAAAFGWKAAIAIVINTLGVALFFRKSWQQVVLPEEEAVSRKMPRTVILLHVAMLTGIVVFAHHPPMFMGILLFFLGISQAYPQYQDRLILKEALLVAFFLAGLVVLGGQQQWWLQPLLISMDAPTVYVAAIALTAVTDNAALAYLGSLVEGLSDGFKYALVAGAVTGGGLTVIANAPNPAGLAILRQHFEEGAVSPLRLFIAALPPTLVAAWAFWYL